MKISASPGKHMSVSTLNNIQSSIDCKTMAMLVLMTRPKSFIYSKESKPLNLMFERPSDSQPIKQMKAANSQLNVS
jgi:hypothetical protein